MMKDIEGSLKGLTPHQKIKFLEGKLEKEKGKKARKEILTLIGGAKQEQLLLEESIQSLEVKPPIQEKEEPLESIVTKAPELEVKKEEVKSHDMYGMEKLETKYLTPENRDKEKYSSEPQGFSMQRFTEEERKKLKKQEEDVSRRQYHSGS